MRLAFKHWNQLSYGIIDGYEIGIQRPELHVSEGDCLHNSAQLLVIMYYLRVSRTIEDISRTKSYRYDFSWITNVQKDGKYLDWNIVNG